MTRKRTRKQVDILRGRPRRAPGVTRLNMPETGKGVTQQRAEGQLGQTSAAGGGSQDIGKGKARASDSQCIQFCLGDFN